MEIKKIKDKGFIRHNDSEVFILSWEADYNLSFCKLDKNNTLISVSNQYFWTALLGEIYSKIESQLPHNLNCYSFTKNAENGNLFFLFYQESFIYQFDRQGNKIKDLNWVELTGKWYGHVPYDMVFQPPHFLWFAFPTGQTVSQVSLIEEKEVFKIGDYSFEDNSDPLSFPESISIIGQNLYIANMGNNKLFSVNLLTKELELVREFDERLWQFEQTIQGTFIVTDTGVYEITRQ